MAESIQFLDDGGTRTILVGNEVVSLLPGSARIIDAGGYDVHFLKWAHGNWSAQNEGADLLIRIDTIPIPADEEEVFSLVGINPDDFNGDVDWDSFGFGAGAWPSMSSRRIIKTSVIVDGVAQPWGSFFEVLGLTFLPGNKGFKRLNEPVRPSQIFWSGDLQVATLKAHHRAELGISDVALDGVFAIRYSVAKAAILNCTDPAARFGLLRKLNSSRITRWSTGRAVTPVGLFKGHMFVIPDRTMDRLWGSDCDLIADDSNLKTEIWLTDPSSDSFLTFEPLKPTGEVMHDYQTRAWTKNWLETASDIKTTISEKFDKTLADLRAGILPDWQMFEPAFYSNNWTRHDPMGNERKPKESEILSANWYRMSAAGVPIKMSATAISLMARGVINSVNATIQAPRPHDENPLGLPIINPENNQVPKIWAPASWACYGYLMTREALEILCGHEVHSDPEVITFDPLTKSLVVSAKYLEDNFHNHGGPDLDDRICVYLRWDGSDLVGVLIRQPNCSGEYSVAKINPFYFPWKNTNGPIGTLDNDWRVPQVSTKTNWRIIMEFLNPAICQHAFPTCSWNWGETYRMVDALEAMQVATINIGVGPYMNARMICDDLNLHLNWHATPEQIIDACQAEPSRAVIEWNNEQVNNIWDQIASLDPTYRVDLLLWAAKISERRRAGLKTRNGQFWQIWTYARDQINAFAEEARNIGFQLRARNKPEIFSEIEFSPAIINKAQAYINWWTNEALPLIAQEVRENLLSDEVQPSPYRKYNGMLAAAIIKSYTDSNGVLDRESVMSILLCMYDLVTKPQGPERPYGIGDEMLFGPPPTDSIGMFDLMMDALVSVGIADDVHVIKSGRNSNVEVYDRLSLPEAERGAHEQFSLYIGEISAQVADDIFTEWASAANDREAMEMIRFLGLRDRHDTSLVDVICDYLEEGDY